MRPLLTALVAILVASSLVLSQCSADHSSPPPQLHLINPGSPEGLQELFAYNDEPLCFVSAHRGGPQHKFPENCIATFENTLRHTFAIMEIDPRYTKDGAIVVHHDETLERTTTGRGRVSEMTLQELKGMYLKDIDGIVTEFQIPTLDEVLQWARGKTILVLDQKDVPVEVRVGEVQEHRAEAYVILIVYSFEDAKKCYQMNKDIMMEVMIPNRQSFREFDKTGIPWSSVIAFVGHVPPKDAELLQMIHSKRACCIVGTSRNLDREFTANLTSGVSPIKELYRALLESGADMIETDIPIDVGTLLYGESAIPASKPKFFRKLPLSP